MKNSFFSQLVNRHMDTKLSGSAADGRSATEPNPSDSINRGTADQATLAGSPTAHSNQDLPLLVQPRTRSRFEPGFASDAHLTTEAFKESENYSDYNSKKSAEHSINPNSNISPVNSKDGENSGATKPNNIQSTINTENPVEASKQQPTHNPGELLNILNQLGKSKTKSTNYDNRETRFPEYREIHAVNKVNNESNLRNNRIINNQIKAIAKQLQLSELTQSPKADTNFTSSEPAQSRNASSTRQDNQQPINANITPAVHTAHHAYIKENSVHTETIVKNSTGANRANLLGNKAENSPFRTEQKTHNKSNTPEWLNNLQDDLTRLAQQHNTKKEEHVVNVTIGRIEVKAQQPQITPQSKTKPKPKGVMSLDDYLRARNKGGEP